MIFRVFSTPRYERDLNFVKRGGIAITDFTKGFVAAIGITIAVKVSYEYGRSKEADRNAKEKKELQEAIKKAEQRIKDLESEKEKKHIFRK